jgi:hypothetical protein
MKVAFCFIINYEHIVNKEHIWKEWIEPNKDIINIYFFYKDKKLIKSKWILENVIPDKYIEPTSYYHVIPAYINLFKVAYQNYDNEWFCILTDSCCPIISPKRFRYLFFNNFNRSILNWKPAWWNINLQKRANLAYLSKELRLANDPYFILSRNHVSNVLDFKYNHQKIFDLISAGGVANESLFSIILKYTNKLQEVIQSPCHITDWERMMSATSPYLFKEKTSKDNLFIEKTLAENEYIIFIRKIDKNYSDSILRFYIYDYNKKNDYYLFILNIKFLYLFLLISLFIYLTFPSISTIYT